MADPETKELQLEQVQRELAEREQAKESSEPADEQTHERRAAKAAYLKKKLEQRAKSEEELE